MFNFQSGLVTSANYSKVALGGAPVPHRGPVYGQG